MTGIENLREIVRELGKISFCYDLYVRLGNIADQIARERAEDCFRMGERAVEGKVGPKTLHEIALSLLYDWEREAVDRECDRRLGIAADVSMSAYDLLPEEERDAIAWVREHGGIAYVKDAWNVRSNLDRQLEKAQAEVERQQRHIEFVQGKCRERQGRIEELRRTIAEMRPRLVPEGMEWPRYESGEPVRIGDAIVDGLGHAHEVSSVEVFDDAEALHWSPSEPEDFVWLIHGERAKRPAPKVLDADGVEIREGDTVWHVETGEQCKVVEVDSRSVSVDFRVDGDGTKHTGSVLPANLTHERPDSFEQLEKDANDLIYDIGFHLGDYSPSDFKEEGDSVQDRVRDLVRRAKALAGVSE